jgi:hypothetical protein
MNARRTTVLFVVLALVLAMSFAVYATEDPIPEPGEHAALLLEFLPELKGFGTEQWLMTGYRFIYDVYYYDKDDQVVNSETVVIDVVGKGETYVMSEVYTAYFNDAGEMESFEHASYAYDFPGVGQFWISLDAFRGKDAPAIVSDLFTIEEFTWNDETQDAWYAYLTTADGNTDYEYYYNMDNGMLLSLDVYEYDSSGTYQGGRSVKYYDYFDYSAPWLDYGLMELAEGTEISYDLQINTDDGKTMTGVMSYISLENHATWAYLSEILKSEELGDSEGGQVVSEMCTDGLIMWLPAEVIKGISEGDYYFDDTITGSYVTAREALTMGDFGSVRRISFKNGYFEADSYFSETDGVLVKYHQMPSDLKPFEIILTLKEVKK